ncbi:MAG TPA: class II aldolase/adducin family protein [Bacteroidota bacterium]|nr:class II aldolase/adducin family protein [Bacteroidota bacterium]
MDFHLLHPRDQIVRIMDRIYANRLTTLSGGNLSVRDANGDVWITPAGIDKGNLSADDIMCIRADGMTSGPHTPSSEFPFHRWIYEKRPDIFAIVHAHPSALVSFSIVRIVPDTSVIPQARSVCGRVGYAPYALPGSEQLGRNIAGTFASGCNVVLLENHGAVTGGSDLLNAYHRIETLEFCARTIILARRLGGIHTLSGEQIASFDRRDEGLPEFELLRHESRERELRGKIVEVVHRACDRFLMISTEGVVSARVGGDEFLITPTGVDRRSLGREDIVLVRGGKRERGKRPSRSVRLHEAIYRMHPGVGSVITAQSPGVAAYAVTSKRFETRTIPESYILLRDIPVIPFGSQYTEPEEIARNVSETVPVLLIENDCLLTSGGTILEAFDRLEVAESSARSLIDSLPLGDVVPIGEKEIRDIREKYL